MTTIDPKALTMVVHNRNEGDPVVVTITHKPTKKSGTGRGDRMDLAIEAAKLELERAMAGDPNPAPGFIHPQDGGARP